MDEERLAGYTWLTRWPRNRHIKRGRGRFSVALPRRFAMDTTSSHRHRRPQPAPRPARVPAPSCTCTCTSTCTLHISTHLSTHPTAPPTNCAKASRAWYKSDLNKKLQQRPHSARGTSALDSCDSYRASRRPLARQRVATHNSHSPALNSRLRIVSLMRYLPAASLVILFAMPALAADPAEAEFVEKRVRPVLAEHC